MSITAIAALASTLVGPFTELLKEIIPDKDLREKLANQLATQAATQQHENNLGQLGVNKSESTSSHLFVAGWRPFIGWTCGVAMGFNYIAVPLLSIADIELTTLDITTMFPVLLGMLGLGGLRTYEKVQKVARENMEH